MVEEKKDLQLSESPMQLMKIAVEKGTDLDKLEKLLILREKWEAGEAKKEYNKAMAEFKADPPKINKDRAVSFGAGKASYNHASLYNVTDKVNTALSAHGLSASWTTKQNGGIIVTCKITHRKGHSEETTLMAQPDSSGNKNSIQAIGSTITYLERYTLLALTGLATFEQGDDGQATAPEDCIDDKQHHQIMDFIAEKNIDTEKFCMAFGIPDIPKLPKSRFQEAIDKLKKSKGRA